MHCMAHEGQVKRNETAIELTDCILRGKIKLVPIIFQNTVFLMGSAYTARWLSILDLVYSTNKSWFLLRFLLSISTR